jgi:hypothetical protein
MKIKPCKMNRFFFIVFTCGVLLISCGMPKEEVYNEAPVKADSTIKKQAVVSVDSTYDSALVKFPAVTAALKKWVDFYKKKIPEHNYFTRARSQFLTMPPGLINHSW